MNQDGYALLVVDDNEDNRYTLTNRLKRQGYTNLTTAVDGRQALELIRSRPFDLVLLDIMMPELNGYQVLEQLKADEQLRHIPVIMISALDELESVIRCIELGAEDYLPKPFNPTLLKARIGASLERKRLQDQVRAHLVRIEEELRTAREIQMGMLPTLFPAPRSDWRVQLFAVMEAARQVGGDLYDFFDGQDGRLCFVVADVSDKGAPAALFMARAKSLIRLAAALLRPANGAPPQPHEIAGLVNEELCRDNGRCMFVTMFLGMLDPISGELRFCNAGHPAPYLLSRYRGVTALPGGRGRPLGIQPAAAYECGTVNLAPGECLFLYTDGITEAMDTGGALFSEERLEAALRAATVEDAVEVVAAVMGRVRSFAGSAPQSDDIAAMAVRFVPWRP